MASAVRTFFDELFGGLKNSSYLCSMVEQEMKREMGITKGTVPIVRKLYNAASRRVTYGGRN